MGFEKNKHRKPKERFMGIPFSVMKHRDYISLGANAIRLLNEASMQYNGRNNGKICFIWSQMKERGWKSKTTLTSAKKELIGKNILVVSKYGGFISGKGEPQFYALTWQKIDDISDFDMDINPTIQPIRSFKI